MLAHPHISRNSRTQNPRRVRIHPAWRVPPGQRSCASTASPPLRSPLALALLADHVGVSQALALAGVAGCLVGVLAAVSRHHARQDSGSHSLQPVSDQA